MVILLKWKHHPHQVLRQNPPPPSVQEQLVIKVGGTIKAKLGNLKQAYSGEVRV